MAKKKNKYDEVVVINASFDEIIKNRLQEIQNPNQRIKGVIKNPAVAGVTQLFKRISKLKFYN